MGRHVTAAVALGALSAAAAACGSGPTAVQPPSTPLRAVPPALHQVVHAGRLTFRVPSSWSVGFGTCRCGWGTPDTVTLDNGRQDDRGRVSCSCPEESADAPSGLHLYEGTSGLVRTGRTEVVHGLAVEVSSDPATARLSVAFPTLDQWITIAPAPSSRDRATTRGQSALERAILATVQAAPGTPAP
jgi:hypothetical protein